MLIAVLKKNIMMMINIVNSCMSEFSHGAHIKSLSNSWPYNITTHQVCNTSRKKTLALNTRTGRAVCTFLHQFNIYLEVTFAMCTSHTICGSQIRST